MTKKILYFLCTGNSCRSQMADGWARKLLSADWEVYSAGIETHGVNPNAVKAMREIGIDISHHSSDLIDEMILNCATMGRINAPSHHLMYAASTGAFLTRQRPRGQNRRSGRCFKKCVMQLTRGLNGL